MKRKKRVKEIDRGEKPPSKKQIKEYKDRIKEQRDKNRKIKQNKRKDCFKNPLIKKYL